MKDPDFPETQALAYKVVDQMEFVSAELQRVAEYTKTRGSAYLKSKVLNETTYVDGPLKELLSFIEAFRETSEREEQELSAKLSALKAQS